MSCAHRYVRLAWSDTAMEAYVRCVDCGANVDMRTVVLANAVHQRDRGFNQARPGVRYTHVTNDSQGVGLSDGTIAVAMIRGPVRVPARQRTAEEQAKVDALALPRPYLSETSFDPADWRLDPDQGLEARES